MWMSFRSIVKPNHIRLPQRMASFYRKIAKRIALLCLPPIARLYQHRNRLSAEINQLRAEIGLLSAETDQLSTETGRLSRESGQLSAKVKRLSAENRRLSDRCAASEKRLAGFVFDTQNQSVPAASAPADIEKACAAAEAAATTDGPLVSILCITLNADRFLSRAIANMRSQSYRNLEILIQDGGSTDRTLEIFRDAGLADCVVSEPDQGGMDALNRLVRRASGDLIAVCWADDELLPHAIGWAVAQFQSHSADVIYGDQLVVFDSSNTEQLYCPPPWDIRRVMMQEFYPPFSSTFFRRRALLAAFERINARVDDEYEFWLWLGLIGTLLYVPGLVSKFHVHSDSRWTKPGYCEKMVAHRLRALQAITADPLGAPLSAWYNQAEVSMELWAALHEVSISGSIEQCLMHLESIEDQFNGDPRFALALARLLSLSKRSDGEGGQRILRVAQRLGFNLGLTRQ
jgi:hypothetical protein